MEETRKETLLRIGMSLVDKLLKDASPHLLSDRKNVEFEFEKASFTLAIEDLETLLDSYCDDDIDLSYDAAHDLNALLTESKLSRL